ncbi:MAG: NAD(P)-binding domain-containing protein [Candidatus Kaiserbacteria bacterium]|nr:NAD(P)-binding domain-containing protein [Candidatus Kaiserbacteria bacterium]
MNIHYFSGEAWEEAYVRAKLPRETITFHEKSLAAYPDLVDPEMEVLCTFIESPVGEAEMVRFPGLKLIATRSTGFDHIDLAAAKTHGITVVNVPSYGENTVAEFAFALLLSLSRRIPEAEASVKNGVFSPTDFRGYDLEGKTIGIIGCGHIGMHMIRMANGFGMKVLGFETHPDEERARANNFTYASLNDLLAESNIISLHVPYNPHTHHLINKENIGSIKKGAYLINTARGAVVETEALVGALQSGILAGAGLDALEEEGDMADETALLFSPHPNEASLKITLENHYLINHPRVIVTPHLAFNTTEAIERIVSTTTENIRHFAEGTVTNTVA